MTRVFYLDDTVDKNGVPTGQSRNIFDPATRAYVRDKLLTLHGKTGPEGYSILDCGNTDQSDGTPQDKVPAALQALPRLRRLDLRWNKLRSQPRWLDELEERGCTVYV